MWHYHPNRLSAHHRRLIRQIDQRLSCLNHRRRRHRRLLVIRIVNKFRYFREL
jgi:hypothetical protein